MSLNIMPNALNGNPIVSFSGLSSGFDTKAVVDARVSIDAQQVTAIEAQQNLLTSRQNAYNQVGTALQTLQSAARGLQATASVLPASATSSDTAVLTAAAGSGAAQGSLSVAVNAIAQAQSNFSAGFASATQAGLLTPGALNIAVGNNNPISFSIDGTTTLQSLAGQINSSDPDIAASVISDGTQYRLSITGTNTGAANTMAITDAGTGLDLASNVSQNAQNASLTINNALSVTSSTNTISNAIEGVTLQAVMASSTPQTITIGADSSHLVGAVQALVRDYNSVITTINKASPFDGTYDPESLIGDPTLHNLQNELQAALDGPSPNATGAFAALSQLGVSTQADGTLSIDDDALQAAVRTDPQSVASLLSNSNDNKKLGVASCIASVAQSFGASDAGVLAQLSQGIAEQNSTSDDIIRDMQNAVNTYQGTLRQQFVSLEVLMTKLKVQSEIVSAFAYPQTGNAERDQPATSCFAGNTGKTSNTIISQERA